MKEKSEEVVFNTGDNVYCFHGPLMYPAKVMDVRESEENGHEYYIHYSGWNKNWREWVAPTRVLQMNEENRKKKEELQLLDSSSKKRILRDTKSGTSEDEGKKKSRKKQKSDGTVESEEDFAARIEVKLAIPDELRRQLVDDWDLVNNQKQTVPLPREPTVSAILQKYKQSRSKGIPAYVKILGDDVISEVVDGLKVYFDQALGTLLLYKFERHQYEKYLDGNPDADMSDVYGGEHLLRLFVKLPMLLAHTNINEDSLNILIEHLSDFLAYLVKEFGDIFLSEYQTPSPDYIKHAT